MKLSRRALAASVIFLLLLWGNVFRVVPALIKGESIVNGRTVAEWTADLKSNDDAVRANAAYELCRIRQSARPLVGELGGLLRDERASVRQSAAEILGCIGPDA